MTPGLMGLWDGPRHAHSAALELASQPLRDTRLAQGRPQQAGMIGTLGDGDRQDFRAMPLSRIGGGNRERGDGGRHLWAIASNSYTMAAMESGTEIAAALRQIARGFGMLADAVAREEGQPPESARAAALLREWGDQGLNRTEASVLFRRHGFAPQTAGGWTRADWIEMRSDGRRYVTKSSREWLSAREAMQPGG
jgi:hypothetical protein